MRCDRAIKQEEEEDTKWRDDKPTAEQAVVKGRDGAHGFSRCAKVIRQEVLHILIIMIW